MVALLGELVSEREPVLLYESPESFHCTVVRVKENLSQRNNLEKKEKERISFVKYMYTVHAFSMSNTKYLVFTKLHLNTFNLAHKYRRHWLLSACAYKNEQQGNMCLTASVRLIERA